LFLFIGNFKKNYVLPKVTAIKFHFSYFRVSIRVESKSSPKNYLGHNGIDSLAEFNKNPIEILNTPVNADNDKMISPIG
jgi:hypothetical protein